MTDYKSLGLVNTKEMFAKAVHGGYAIPAFNFNNMEQLQAIIKAAADTKSPVILQVSKGARNYANPILLRYMARVQWSMPGRSAGSIRRLSSTSTTETRSNSARTVSRTDSHL